ncbi:MAG: hypothetical protein QOH58_1943 [Thermoleophilaceae bacterium]|nr:hypothetical protein [Thermoleophilaceae bacterium]
MPLSEVRAGMLCTGLSVVRGTEIASFDVEVLDVIADDPATGGARLLVRVSGAAVDSTGVGPGFSGSPIICGGRNAGAISEGIGEYGNKVVLATPIEAILGARPRPSPVARRAPGLLRSARSLAGPLTVSGLSTGARRLLTRAARRKGLTVLAAPPGPLGGYPAQDLRPGAAVGASLSTGDISVGAVGTVAYRDGDTVFAFGHALDGLGRRSLFLQDSYVFGVIGNPLGVPDLGAMTYKLASSGGHPLGTFTNDTFAAIAGGLGAEPPSIPLRITARRSGAREQVVLDSRLADERKLGLGAGMGLIAPLAASTALDRLQGSLEPVALSVCTRFRVRELRRVIGFCNPYFDSFAAFADVAEAAALVDDFDLAPLRIRGAAVSIVAEGAFADEVLASATAPPSVRAGSTVPVRIALRRRGGGARSVTVQVPVPAGLPPGVRTLVLSGNGFEDDGEDLLIELVSELSGPTASASLSEPGSVRQLARRVAALRHPLGIVARFKRRATRVVLRSSAVRFDGRVKLRLRVVPARR